jgi:hypothetical protein
MAREAELSDTKRYLIGRCRTLETNGGIVASAEVFGLDSISIAACQRVAGRHTRTCGRSAAAGSWRPSSSQAAIRPACRESVS